MNRELKRDFLWATLLIFVALGFFLPHLGEFVYPFGSRYSDLVISHYSNLMFLKTAISKYHQIPFWSDSILSGYPFAADPLSGLWYLPTWAAVFTPAPFGINLLVLGHLIFGGVGMYFFLKDQGLVFWAALLGGLSYALMPKLSAHYAAGHITLVFAICWTPWLLLAEQKRRAGAGGRLGRLLFLLPGILLGEIFLADPRWVVYAGGLWCLYAIKLQLENGKQLDFSTIKNPHYNVSWTKWLLGMVTQIPVALLIAAPLLLPLIQFSKLSTRSLMVSADNLILSLDFLRLFGLVIPDMAGYAEFIVYPGALLAVALIWTLFHRKARERNWFWLLLFLITILYSLGENIPLVPVLARLPGMRLLRVPSRVLFLTGFAFSVIFANTLQDLIAQRNRDEEEGRSGNVFLVGLAGFLSLITIGIWFLSGSMPVEFVWGSAAVLLAVILILLYEKRRISNLFAICGFAVVLCLDLGGVNISQMDFYDKADIMGEKADLVNFFSEETAPFRIYSPSYSIPQQAAVLNGLELADGIDPLQLMPYVGFMEKATGIPINSYSVTMPPFSSGNPGSDNQSFVPDAQQLGLLNVKYVAAEFPISSEDLVFVKRFDDTWLYKNTKALPRAWVQDSIDEQTGGRVRPAEILEWTPNRIVVEAEGPGLLVLSEIFYPGWKVKVDGQSSDLEKPLGLLRGVLLESGVHTVAFDFRPILVYLGVLLGILVLAGILFFVWSD